MSVTDLNNKLKHILVDPALKVFPHRKQRTYINFSNESSIP